MDCVLTDWRLNPGGYGQRSARRDGKVVTLYAHLEAWKEDHGPVPPGMEVDHTCNVRACIEKTHLQLVTSKRNKELRWERHPAPDTCPEGHQDWGQRKNRKARWCRPCNAAASRRWRAAQSR